MPLDQYEKVKSQGPSLVTREELQAYTMSWREMWDRTRRGYRKAAPFLKERVVPALGLINPMAGQVARGAMAVGDAVFSQSAPRGNDNEESEFKVFTMETYKREKAMFTVRPTKPSKSDRFTNFAMRYLAGQQFSASEVQHLLNNRLEFEGEVARLRISGTHREESEPSHTDEGKQIKMKLKRSGVEQNPGPYPSKWHEDTKAFCKLLGIGYCSNCFMPSSPGKPLSFDHCPHNELYCQTDCDLTQKSCQCGFPAEPDPKCTRHPAYSNFMNLGVVPILFDGTVSAVSANLYKYLEGKVLATDFKKLMSSIRYKAYTPIQLKLGEKPEDVDSYVVLNLCPWTWWKKHGREVLDEVLYLLTYPDSSEHFVAHMMGNLMEAAKLQSAVNTLAVPVNEDMGEMKVFTMKRTGFTFDDDLNLEEPDVAGIPVEGGDDDEDFPIVVRRPVPTGAAGAAPLPQPLPAAPQPQPQRDRGRALEREPPAPRAKSVPSVQLEEGLDVIPSALNVDPADRYFPTRMLTLCLAKPTSNNSFFSYQHNAFMSVMRGKVPPKDKWLPYTIVDVPWVVMEAQRAGHIRFLITTKPIRPEVRLFKIDFGYTTYRVQQKAYHVTNLYQPAEMDTFVQKMHYVKSLNPHFEAAENLYITYIQGIATAAEGNSFEFPLMAAYMGYPTYTLMTGSINIVDEQLLVEKIGGAPLKYGVATGLGYKVLAGRWDKREFRQDELPCLDPYDFVKSTAFLTALNDSQINVGGTFMCYTLPDLANFLFRAGRKLVPRGDIITPQQQQEMYIAGKNYLMEKKETINETCDDILRYYTNVEQKGRVSLSLKATILAVARKPTVKAIDALIERLEANSQTLFANANKKKLNVQKALAQQMQAEENRKSFPILAARFMLPLLNLVGMRALIKDGRLVWDPYQTNKMLANLQGMLTERNFSRVIYRYLTVQKAKKDGTNPDKFYGFAPADVPQINIEPESRINGYLFERDVDRKQEEKKKQVDVQDAFDMPPPTVVIPKKKDKSLPIVDDNG